MVAGKEVNNETRMIARRLAEVRQRGGRPEYAFEPGGELAGRPPIFYIPETLITTIEHASFVHRLIEEWHGSCGDPEPLLEYDNTLVAFTVEGDSLHIATAIKQAADKYEGDRGDIPVAPLHVLVPAPAPKIGPGDDPSPATAGSMAAKGPKVDAYAPIAVIDTGLWTKPPHPLSAVLGDPNDEETVDGDRDGFVDFYGTGHGGFIAGVVENNAPGSKVIAHNAFGRNGLTEASVINEVDAALQQNEVVVLNLSLGSYEKDDRGRNRIELVALRTAMRRWRDKHPGALIVAAAGNDAKSDPFFPAGFAGEPEFAEMVVSVGALTQPAEEVGIHAAAASFSNHGSWVTAWAPGDMVVSSYPDDMKFGYVDAAGTVLSSAFFGDGLAHWSGTSFAAPFVAAEIIREMRQGESPRDTWKRIRGASPFVIFWPGW